MYSEIIGSVLTTFGTTQPFYLEQQSDGRYIKKSGEINHTVLERMLRNQGSIGVYQKNENTSINWICFDFDIIKEKLEGDGRELAEQALFKTVKTFCETLKLFEISYLLEYSGNRGFHIWITFQSSFDYSAGAQIIDAIKTIVNLEIDSSLIAVDLFPLSASPSQGPGKGVKLPLSKHKKSNRYSTLLTSIDEMHQYRDISVLDLNLLNQNIEILKNHNGMSKESLEKILNISIKSHDDEIIFRHRISSIQVKTANITISELQTHWANNELLKKFSQKIFINKVVSHNERRLLVGMFLNIETKTKPIGKNLLHEIFKSLEDYDENITEKALGSLGGYQFPSQEQIEQIIGGKLAENLSVDDLLAICIPSYEKYVNATFKMSPLDARIVQIAEQNYLLTNDEVVIKSIVDELARTDNSLYDNVLSLFEDISNIQYYEHIRKEENKERKLYALDAKARVLTTFIVKQLGYFLNFTTNSNSYGYIFNNGLSKGYIFKPWLYSWINFLKNISEVLDDQYYADFYIVKTDISKFYDSIPHDSLKRMMLGGVNPKIDKQRGALAPESPEDKKYQRLIDILFLITKQLVKSNIGLPQGPAYARFLAELYLDNVDEYFDKEIRNNHILFYQRYVDDIFFVTRDRNEADKYLADLKEQLSLLGLEVNNEKTYINQIKNFKNTFDVYRSQSKYAVDSVAKDFENSTDKQKDLAVQEFLRLLESEHSNDDLAFIFSHLNGVGILDKQKRERVLPVILSGIGRGSLYKHLFKFVLEDKLNHQMFDSVDKFNELQSEVLTSIFITTLESQETLRDDLITLFNCIINKLTVTPVVIENLCYLTVIYGINYNIEKIPEVTLLKVLTLCDNKNIIIDTKLLAYLNTHLNNIDDLSTFIESIYSLVTKSNLGAQELNNLAALFYAKLSSEQHNKKLENNTHTFRAAYVVAQFYYLLCLFSASNKNKSIPLLESMWKLCSYLYHFYDINLEDDSFKNWAIKLCDLDISQEVSSYIISSIVEGNIFRGEYDHKNIFAKYHSIFLVVLAFDRKNLHEVDFAEAYKRLRGKSVFYDWLIDRSQVSLFPTSKYWFEKNTIDNNVIFLKNGQGKILIRRPSQEFYDQSKVSNSEYSDVLVDYRPQEMMSLLALLRGTSTIRIFSSLTEYLDCYDVGGIYPNIFCHENIIYKNNNLKFFSDELLVSNKIILEKNDSDVQSYTNNRDNFIRCFLAIASQVDSNISHINNLYLQKIFTSFKEIDTKIFLQEFVKKIALLENAVDFSISANLLIAYALYNSLTLNEPLGKLKVFDKIYNSFLEIENRSLYVVVPGMEIEDKKLPDIFNTVTNSLKSIKKLTTISEGFLEEDVDNYMNLLKCILQNTTLSLADFKKIEISSISVTKEIIKINGKSYRFSEFNFISIKQQEIITLSANYFVQLQSSEHVYMAEKDGCKYLFVLEEFLSKFYLALEQKKSLLDWDISSLPNQLFIEDVYFDGLDRFSHAINIVKNQRDISEDEASILLKQWLSFLPKEYHQHLVTIIAAHCDITEADVSGFLNFVSQKLKQNHKNIYLLKKQSDHNGTHRLLYKDSIIGRQISDLSLENYSDDTDTITIVVDVIISGAQFIKALKFYSGKGPYTFSESDNFFEFSPNHIEILHRGFKNLNVINICTALYTQNGISAISNWCKENLNPNIEIKVVNGRNINGNGVFLSSSNINNSTKENIKAALTIEKFKRLCMYFEHETESRKKFKLEEMNLVARYQSLPKRALFLLHAKLKANPNMTLMVKVPEKADLK